MKRVSIFLFALVLCSVSKADAQIYAKLNGLYALVGVINPSVEFTLSPKSTFQTEIIYSPWQSIRHNGANKPMHFAIFMNEYRRYFRQHNSGWYLGANMGMMGFKMSKLEVVNHRLTLQNRYCKGYGFMLGISGGYEYQFAERWLLDVYFGWAYMLSWYNGYSLDGTIDMTPHRPEQLDKPDPFNGSAEWLPNKIGVSIGFMIFNPAKKRRHADAL